MNTELKTEIEAGIGEYRKSGKRWVITPEKIREARAAGWEKFQGANLRRADLCGAYLGDADLRGADLCGAKIDDDKTITGYFTRTRIGGDNAELQVAYNATDIWIERGCSGWLTPDEFLARVDETHGDRLHGQIYRLTINHICEVVKLERQLQEAKRG